MIYVVDVDHMRLAFAARNETHAAQIASSRLFAQAIGRSELDPPGPQTSSHHPRAATLQEHVVYHDMSVEFADAAVDILVARVG